ncbi:hypothetical protein HYH03_008739 [Edaphochlamys debaryana]|uniref:Protein kinase domain-containing protein n=1 Tax=Edaphochlamys debaryana TaxID=47281 RepID=A0A836BXS6_9CHLO|nr:hypothetical protein HYH03_008739 [Edaphochlamys debaryana]|eukprot:KAG2493076.1 hypothetical protein HYH03_008739 [Edaphochlamys debaryana]
MPYPVGGTRVLGGVDITEPVPGPRRGHALAVALSASNIRDIAPSDPAMRQLHLRHLKPLSYGPGTVVFKGTWQGLLLAVKFQLLRRNPGTAQAADGTGAGAGAESATAIAAAPADSSAEAAHRQLSSLLLAHCVSHHSRCARVYACDLSRVEAAEPAEAGAPPALTLRPCNPGEEGDCAACAMEPEHEEVGMGDDNDSCGPSHSASVPRRRCSGGIPGSHFHFSSVVYAEASSSQPMVPSTAAAAGAPDCRTLAGLLSYLGARPGDHVVHVVMELSTGGNLWQGIGCGAYDALGVLGPRGALQMVLHSARGIASGLQQLHTSGDAHGSLTPSNVLLHWAVSDGEISAGSCESVSGVGRFSVSCGGSTGAPRRRRGLAARIADCGMRRLVLGREGWRAALPLEGSELHSCAAPELLASAREAGSAGVLEPSPAQDIYAFGALLYTMCTGVLPPSAATSAPVWPAHVWAPLRRLGEACMAAQPAARPSAASLSRTLLVWAQRLRASRTRQYLSYGAVPGHCLRIPTAASVGASAPASALQGERVAEGGAAAAGSSSGARGGSGRGAAGAKTSSASCAGRAGVAVAVAAAAHASPSLAQVLAGAGSAEEFRFSRFSSAAAAALSSSTIQAKGGD